MTDNTYDATLDYEYLGDYPPLPPTTHQRTQQPHEWIAEELRLWAADETGHYQEVLLTAAGMLEQMGFELYGTRTKPDGQEEPDQG